MARRKLLKGKEEIEYRLMDFIRSRRSFKSSHAAVAELTAIFALAEMQGVQISQKLIDAVRSTGVYAPRKTSESEPIETPTQEIKPLTPDPVGSIIEELENL
jgi:hypothetical protein